MRTCQQTTRAVTVRSATALILCVLVCACGGPADPRASGGSSADGIHTPVSDPLQGVAHDWFTDSAPSAGLDFVHFNGMSGAFYLPEIMGPGVGLFDYDNDGDLDVFLPQGRMLGPGKALEDASIAAPARLPVQGRLYRNDLTVHPDGTRTMRFTDVTDETGIAAREYGMGVAAGDIDNDGWVDLYLTNFGRNRMFRNLGNGRFADVSKQSGTDHSGWTVSAAFVDYDRDGWLDLFVGNYLQYSIETDKECLSEAGTRHYCGPERYRGEPDRLFRNQGNGRFVDVTETALIGRRAGAALGVVTADLNGDGWPDIYVANDGTENHLWINQRNGTFRNTALLAGAAMPIEGQQEASMGVDAGDFDNDGDDDLFMTELNGEGSNLFVNDGSGTFEDWGTASGLGPASTRYTGFGTAWFDFDNDGWLDLLSANGTVGTLEQRARAVSPYAPYAQRLLLFRNLRNGRFEEVGGRAGAVFRSAAVGRGAAFGDIDNDGDVDVVVANDAGPVQLLVNRVGNRRHWIGLKLIGDKEPRDMLGARVAVVTSGGRTLWRRARADGSYASSNDPRALVGLGDAVGAVTVRVRWPAGGTEEWHDVSIDRWVTVKEGTGR